MSAPVDSAPPPASVVVGTPVELPIGRKNDIVGLIDRVKYDAISDTEVYHSLRRMGLPNELALNYVGLVASVRI